MTSTWRLIVSPPSKGSLNMAIDEALLTGVIERTSPPTIRLFSWQPACLSLGFAQPYAEVDPDLLLQFGWDLVRRPTGGRAILHIDELTYSMIAPDSNPIMAGGILESYQRISAGLQNFLQLMGLQPESKEKVDPSQAQQSPEPICFEVPSHYEITIHSKKIIGSAQARRKDGVLQHGSIPLEGDISRIATVLRYSDESTRQSTIQRVRERATTVSNELGRMVAIDEAILLFKQAISQTLDISLAEDELTPTELQLAKNLENTKYASQTWTQRS